MITQIKRGSTSYSSLAWLAACIVIAGMLLPMNASACHRGAPHGKNAAPCFDGFPPGVGGKTSAGFNDEFFDVAFQTFDRLPTSTDTAGDYVADNPGSNLVTIDLQGLSKSSSSRKKADLCHMMDDDFTDPRANGPFVSAPDTFSYGWIDNCTDDGCDIEISMSFSGTDVSTFTGGLSDSITVLMQGSIDQATASDDPFDVAQQVGSPNGIPTMTVTYNKIGTSRTLVECTHSPQGDGGAILISNPQ
jgi:hypothetical protein